MLKRALQNPALYSQVISRGSVNTFSVATASLCSVSSKGSLTLLRSRISVSKTTRSHCSRNARLSGTMAARAVGVDYNCFESSSRASSALIDSNEARDVVTIELLCPSDSENWKSTLSDRERQWVNSGAFGGNDGDVMMIPSETGGIGKVAFMVEDTCDLWAYAVLPSKLPKGHYAISVAENPAVANAVALGWMLGTYSFDRFKSEKENGQGKDRLLVKPTGCAEHVTALAEGIFFARDMISTPAENMAPQHIEEEARKMAALHGASISSIVGDDLLKENYPAIHTVGRASTNEPRLIDIRWSPSAGTDFPKVTLVGKGVAFDTGGLDLKPANAMKLMKKDMGGAALVMGLAHAIMKTKVPVQLRVLVPAVENSVSGNAFRPLDVLQTRAGITVENGNTDAEGRLILCDALAEAVSENPDLLLDAATLTGAARVALGTDVPALFCNNDEVAEGILACSNEARDIMWRMPLHKPYKQMIKSKVADIGSCSEGGYAGAITAALFLEEFVKDASAWVHIDTMGYNLSSKPGRPEGGEALALRGLYTYLSKNYLH